MNRCLRDRALSRITAGGGTPAQRAHLRVGPDCAERDDGLADDVAAIGNVLVQGPPTGYAVSHMPGVFSWAPLAAAAAVLLAVGLTLTRLLAPMPVQVAAR